MIISNKGSPILQHFDMQPALQYRGRESFEDASIQEPVAQADTLHHGLHFQVLVLSAVSNHDRTSALTKRSSQR